MLNFKLGKVNNNIWDKLYITGSQNHQLHTEEFDMDHQDQRHIILTAPSTLSLDSWDFENLKYLRKISCPTNSTQLDPYSGTEDSESEINEINEQFHNKTNCNEQFIHHNGKEVIVSENLSDKNGSIKAEQGNEIEISISKFEEYDGENSIMENDLDKFSLTGPLDNCYLLDVVTIRNESVLANRRSSSSKLLLGSDGYETASSVGSSTEERSFFHPDVGVLDSLSEDYFKRSLSGSGFSEPRLSVNMNSKRVQSTCPYCGDRRSSTTNSNSRETSRDNDNVFFEKVRRNSFREMSLIPTHGSEHTQTSETSSPYYVRLRRDLFLPKCSTPQMKPLKNFGIDQQGQLFIDYSSNWEGLEMYIRNLKLYG